MNRFQYPVKLAAAEEGGYVVSYRDLPELITQGEDEQDALSQASDAMDEVFATYMIEGTDFPEPSTAKRREHRVAPTAEIMAKAALYVAMREAGISKTELAKRLGVDEKEVHPRPKTAVVTPRRWEGRTAWTSRRSMIPVRSTAARAFLRPARTRRCRSSAASGSSRACT